MSLDCREGGPGWDMMQHVDRAATEMGDRMAGGENSIMQIVVRTRELGAAQRAAMPDLRDLSLDRVEVK